MGNSLQGNGRSSTNSAQLCEEENESFRRLWEVLDQSNERHMSKEQFVQQFERSPDVARIIFVYLSLNNPAIEREFMKERLKDIRTHTSTHQHAFVAAPWGTLVAAIGLEVNAILQVATQCSQLTWTSEITSIPELVSRFPTLDLHFNRSVDQLISHFDTWEETLSAVPVGTLDASQQRLMELMVPSLDMKNCHRLFSFSQQGASFRALAASIKFYPGELLLVAKDGEGRLFGVYSKRSVWTETIDKFDETARDSIIFQLYPQLRIRRVNQRGGSNCAYFNVSNPNHPVGLGFGGQESAFRFWIDGTDVCLVKSMSFDATFEPGQILSSTNGAGDDLVETRAVSMEIYGFGGSEALEELQTRRAADQEVRMSRKKVDRMRMVQNEFDKEMFFSKTFKQSGKEADRLGS
jgi:hypothetical protein